MNPEEQQFAAALQADPNNWDLRLGLAERLIQRGEVTESKTLISSVTTAPSSEEQMRRALSFFSGKPTGGNWGPLLQSYLSVHRNDASAHKAYAHMLTMVGSLDGARQHYLTALSLDPSQVDPGLADALSIPAEVEIQEPVVDDSVQAAVPAVIEPTPVQAKEETPVIEPVAPRQEIQESPLEPEPEIISEDQTLEPETPAAEEPVQESQDVQNPEIEEEAKTESEIGEESSAEEESTETSETKSDKALITAEGEVPKAAEKESDQKDKKAALITAAVIHAVLLILFALWTVAQPAQAPPQIVTRAPDTDREDTKSVERKKVQTQPASSANQMNVVTSFSASAVALPDLTNPTEAFDVVGLNDLGSSMDFGGGSKGGTVSFFGSRSSGKKIVFVVDASASMKNQGELGKTRFQLMKEELKKSVGSLPAGVAYQIIFFAGPAWFAGQPVDRENWHDKNGRNHWYYKSGDVSELPQSKLLRASPGRVSATMKDIDSATMVFGTDWRAPLKMAMNLKPDLIFFMTDGSIEQDPAQTPVVEDILSYNKKQSKAKINCICLMELQAFEMMEELSRGTGGEFSLVLENGDVVRGPAVARIAAQQK